MTKQPKIWCRKGQAEKVEPVLKSWQKVLATYEREVSEEKGYPYSERAYVSLLAAAIWTLKGRNVAIEEYIARRRNNSGRVDLWFQLAETGYLVEAKRIKRRFQGKQLLEFLDSFLNEAIEQLSNLDKSETINQKKEPYKKLAIAFVIPTLDDNAFELFLKELSEIKNAARLDFIAPYRRNPTLLKRKGDNTQNRGLALVGRFS